MKNRKHQSQHNRISWLWATFVCVAILVASLGVFTLAKYVSTESSQNVYVAKSFYFESDLLAPESESMPMYTLKAGVDEITVCVMNYPDELRVSESEIRCDVLLTPQEGASIQKTVVLAANVREAKTVTFEDLPSGTYTVTATSVSPYASTLQGQFTVVALDMEVEFSVNDSEKSPFLQVVVTTTDYQGEISIAWPKGVVPDNTDPLLANAKGNSCTVSVAAYSQYTFMFYKNNPDKNYTDQITVTKKSA